MNAIACPFCDSDSISVLEVEAGSFYAAGCQACGCHGPVEETEALAVENWNRRFDVHGGVVLPRVQG